MSRRTDTVVLGANAPTLDVFIVERDSDAYWIITVTLDDIDSAITSADTVESAIQHFRNNVSDTSPRLILGTAPDRSGIVLTRPNPNQLVIAVHITPEQSRDSLDLTPMGIVATDLRAYGVPAEGVTDIKLILDNDNEHFVVRAKVRADLLVTRINSEP